MALEGSTDHTEQSRSRLGVAAGELSRLVRALRSVRLGGVVALVAGFATLVSCGGCYAYGNLTTYMTSHLHVTVGDDVGYPEASWVGTLLHITSGLSYLPGSMLYRRFGARVTILLGSFCLSGAVALTYFTVQTSLVWTAVTYGALNGIGEGLMYMVPLLVCHKWFPRNKGLVTGVVNGGLGLGSILFTALQTTFLNPDNVSPLEEDGFFHDSALLRRVPSVFLLEAAVATGLQLLGVLGVRDPPTGTTRQSGAAVEAKVEPRSRQEETVKSLQIVTGRSESAPPIDNDRNIWWHTLREAARTQSIYALLFGYASAKYCAAIINPLWKAFGQTFVTDDYFLTLVGSGSAVFNMLGRPAAGFLCDKVGYKLALSVLLTVLAILFFSLPWTPVGGKTALMIWVWAISFFYAGSLPVMLVGVAESFGAENAGQIGSVVALTTALSLPLNTMLCNVLLRSHGFTAAFLLAGALATAGLAATLALGRRSRH